MTGHVGDMTVPQAPFLFSRTLFLEPQSSTSCSLGSEGGRCTIVGVTAQLGEHPGVPELPVHPSQYHCPAAYLALGHVTPELQRGDNQPGLFFVYFFSLRRKWLIKTPV